MRGDYGQRYVDHGQDSGERLRSWAMETMGDARGSLLWAIEIMVVDRGQR